MHSNSRLSHHTIHHKIARYVMIGGFLGSGKTTALHHIANAFSQRELKVGLITNDQGKGLVDTMSLKAKGFATEEISGGCFCCRFHSLADAANRLKTALSPDIFIAEPVGSCTDLVATVSYPLRRMYGKKYVISPLSVMVDPVRAQRIFGLSKGRSCFSEKVIYIYKKQLEEADLIIINKVDLIDEDALSNLCNILDERFSARILCVSARFGKGMKEWFEIISKEMQSTNSTMHVNYETYADGESQLGWLNASVKIEAVRDFDGNEMLREIAECFQKEMEMFGCEIAHLKMTLSPREGLGDLAVVNVVRNDWIAELGQQLEGEMRTGDLIVNLRAEANPRDLEVIFQKGLDKIQGASSKGLRFRIEDLEQFRPSKPQPTYRDEKCNSYNSYNS